MLGQSKNLNVRGSMVMSLFITPRWVPSFRGGACKKYIFVYCLRIRTVPIYLSSTSSSMMLVSVAHSRLFDRDRRRM